ncbi:MAG: glycosyltransferase [Syntrophaceae bacterium]|nr:glycosyltransferase [Syntrophaceae bacterium]
MKIMAVNNTVMVERDKGLFIYKETGKFFFDLQQNSNQVYVFQMSMKPASNKNVGFVADYDISNKDFNIVAIKRRKFRLWAYIKTVFKGFQTIRKVDFVYLFYPGHVCSALALMSLFLGKRFGFYIRGEQGFMSKISKYLYRKATVIFTVSPKFTDIVKQAGANAVTIRPLIEFAEEDIIRNREYSSKGKYRILFVGRIESNKGIFELVEAVRLLKEKEIINFEVHMVGDGVDMQSLKEIIEKHTLSDFFVFHGTVTERTALADHYKNADIFVLPTHREGFPRVLYEAMIFGVPIMTTFVGGISGIMKDGVNCYRLEPKDAAGLSSKLMNFLSDYEKKSVIARNATQTIVEYLSDKKDKPAIQLLKVIKSFS